MKTFIKLLGVAFFCVATSTWGIVIDFEDLSGGGALPSDYHGLTWANWTYFDSPQPPYNPSSGSERIYNSDFATAGIVQFGQAVTFVGAWLAGVSFDQYFEGYFNGIKIFESTHTAGDGSDFGQYFTLNWAGVDEIRVQSASGNHYILDDLTYNIFGETNGVPNSGTSVVLFGIALLGLAIMPRFCDRRRCPS